MVPSASARREDSVRNMPRTARKAFSLVEALVASTVTALAGAALLTAVVSTVGSGRQAVWRAVAEGVGQLLLEEISTAPFPTATSTRPLDRSTRTDFDDVDDYDGYVDMPPSRPDGQPLGSDSLEWQEAEPRTRLQDMVANPTLLSRLRRRVRVEPVEPGSNGWRPASSDAPFRRVTVTVQRVDVDGTARTLYQATRILAHVPAARELEPQ